ncbi:MAG: hypothetical protein RIQ89_1315 [Bacteroidota bacterium]|jgi:thioredoxin 1
MLILKDYYATWCEPCKWVEPILIEALRGIEDRIKLEKVDIDEHAEEAKNMEIKSVPTLVLLHDQKEIWRMQGFKTASEMRSLLSNFLNDHF